MDTPEQSPQSPTPGPVAQSHGQRAKIETIVALIGAVFGGVAMLSGLHPIAQGLIGGAVAVVILYAGISHLRARGARKRGA